jgi:hypothetical protein
VEVEEKFKSIKRPYQEAAEKIAKDTERIFAEASAKPKQESKPKPESQPAVKLTPRQASIQAKKREKEESS